MEYVPSDIPTRRVCTSGGSPAGVAALAAVLHLAVLASRMPGRSAHAVPSLLWNAGSAPAERHGDADGDAAPSNPQQTYCVGRIALTSGMAVVALACWLHVMRLGSARGL